MLSLGEDDLTSHRFSIPKLVSGMAFNLWLLHPTRERLATPVMFMLLMHE